MSYTLASPIPNLSDLGSGPQGIPIEGGRVMWKDSSDNIHYLGTFGGFTSTNWTGNYVNLTTGVGSLLYGNHRGKAWAFAYDPANGLLYIGTNYGGSWSVLDDNTGELTVISNSMYSVCGNYGDSNGLTMGDGGQCFYIDNGNSSSGGNNLYYYTVGGGLQSMGTLPQSTYSNYNVGLAADSTYVYVSFKRANGTWTLLISPISPTPSWSAWEFDAAGDTFIRIGKDTSGNWDLMRQNGGLWYKYRLYDGAAHAFEFDDYPWANTSYPPWSNISDDTLESAYGWNVSSADLYPIKDIHEFSKITYDNGGDPDYVQYDYTGPWFDTPTVAIAPVTGSSDVFGVMQDYGAGFTQNTSTEDITYLGPTVLSPYGQVYIHPTTGKRYVGGYPSYVWEYNPAQSWTLSASNMTAGNPKMITLTDGTFHYRFGMAFDANGLVWIGGNNKNAPLYGSVCWYNPSNGTSSSSIWDWSSSGYMFGSMCSCLNGSKIIVADKNRHIYKIDADTQTDDEETITLSTGLVTFLATVAEDRVVVVTVTNSAPLGAIGLLQPSTMTWVIEMANISTSGYPFGTPDLFGFTPLKRVHLEVGPDCYVWMFMSNSLYRISPDDLSFELIKECGLYGNIRFTNNNQDLMIYGIETELYGLKSIFTYTPDIPTYFSLTLGDGHTLLITESGSRVI